MRVRPRHERIVATGLRAKGYEEFLPLYRKQSKWSDRTKTIELPLFPGYVFCQSDLSGRPPAVTTPGAIGFLSFGATMAIISEKEISDLKSLLTSGLNVAPWPYLNVGARVRIDRGAMSGIQGILLQIKGAYRIVLSVDVLCRSVAVEIDREWVSPLSSQAAKAASC